MKKAVLILALLSVACGKGGGSNGTATKAPIANPGSPAPATHTYVMQISGDVDMTGSQDYYSFTMCVNQLDPDVQTIGTGNVGPIVAGQTVTYTLTGRYLRAIQINKNNDTAPEAGLQGKLYRDGVLVRTGSILHLGGTWDLFPDQN